MLTDQGRQARVLGCQRRGEVHLVLLGNHGSGQSQGEEVLDLHDVLLSSYRGASLGVSEQRRRYASAVLLRA